MEGIGQLAGGIAHDFNNLLTVINSYSDMLLGEVGAEHSFVRNGLDQIKEAGHRAASLTRQLLAFTRQQVLEPKILDLNESVSTMAKLLRRLIGEDIALVLSPHPALGRVKVDPGQVEAAQSLGMSRVLILWRVVLPQAFKIALPPYGNTCIMLLKDTSQTSIITVAELSFQGRLIASSTFKNTEIFTLVAVWYLVMCVPLILLVGRLEKKFGRK